MRIRNSRRPSMPIPLLPPEIVQRSSRFLTRGPLINDRFLVQEGFQTLLGPGSGSRTANWSRTVQRFGREDGSNCPSVVLALPARSFWPEKDLPVKKRMFYRMYIVRNKAEAKTTEKNDGAMQERAAVIEINQNVTPISEKEDPFEINKGCRKSRSVRCALNRESFIPCPMISSLKKRGKVEDSVVGALLVKQKEMEKRRRGRPKKKPKTPRGSYGFRKSIYVLD